MKLNIIRNSVKGSALFLGMAMLLCGCQNDEFASMKYAQSDAAVRFAPSIAAMSGDDELTKATLYNTTGDDTHKLSEYLTEFQVAAWEGTSGTTNFIPADTKVKYITGWNPDGEGEDESVWSTVDGSGKVVEYFWKSSAATKTFFAWANLPESGATVACTGAAGQTLTLTALPDKDILMGVYQGDGKTGSPAVMTGTAGIHFYHPLTAVRFKEGTLSEGVSITGISIEGVYASGKATQSAADPSTFVWTKTDDSAFAAADETDTASLSDVTVDGDGFIGEAIVLIPETFASDAARIVVTLETPTGERTAYYPLNGKSWAAGCTNVITIGYDNSECIRFSAPTAHSISFNFTTPATGQSFSMQYSTDATTWTNYTAGTDIEFGPSNDVYFRGKNPAGLGNSPSSSVYEGCTFQITDGSAADVTVSGDIMALIDYEDITVDIPACAFVDLFKGCTAIKTAVNLQLSAGTLSGGCYYQMFYGCTGLKNAPELFSETLANYCYYNMFYGCTSLKKAPVIHATTVKSSCFSGMFQGCTNLIDVQSNLYAETLAGTCYSSMFEGCTSLKKAPVIHATTLANGCCQRMFYGCTSLETVQPVLPVETMAPYCYNYMFGGCTSLKTAPDINVQTLANGCFQNMFSKCSRLENVQSDLEPKTLTQGCYSGMFHSCTSLKKAPVIHATSLLKNSCFEMFRDCSNLEYVKCLISAGFESVSCIDRMLEGVSSTGIFVYNHDFEDEEAVRNAYMYNGSDGPVCAIPDDWTLVPDNVE